MRCLTLRSHAALREQRVTDGTLCSSLRSYTELNSAVRCVSGGSNGNTITFSDLSPVIILNVTFRFKSVPAVTKMVDLQKIGESRLRAQTRWLSELWRPAHDLLHLLQKRSSSDTNESFFCAFSLQMLCWPPGCCTFCDFFVDLWPLFPCSQTQKSSGVECHLPPWAVPGSYPRQDALSQRLPENREATVPAAHLDGNLQHGSAHPPMFVFLLCVCVFTGFLLMFVCRLKTFRR